jgi:hypothetical protein
MANHSASEQKSRAKKVKPTTRLTRNDKNVLKRARILPRGKTSKSRKEANNESSK